MKIVRREYPRPDLKRRQWENLNGKWGFAYNIESDKLPDLLQGDLKEEINVPFCPESKLSGLGIVDKFIHNCLYKRTFIAKKTCGRLLLNFEAVYYACEVFVNGKNVGAHKGGHTPFSLDITDYVIDGVNSLAVYCTSDLTSEVQPSGKQSRQINSYLVFYTRTTGIWQTVWLEYVPDAYVEKTFVKGDTDGNVNFELLYKGNANNLRITVKDGRKVVYSNTFTTENGKVEGSFKVSNPKIWSAESPNLYDIVYELIGETCTDKVESYFGLRTVCVEDDKIYINGKKIFQRLVLDQGYYPDGIYTAKSDKELKKDIILAKNMGFNGARLHQKVFERRFLYHADKLGYYVWGEYPSWGFDHSREDAIDHYFPEWKEAMVRDYNHPSIICWCPLNENWDYNGRKQNNNFVKELYEKTKEYDNSRFVVDVSWNYHVKTDVYDVHGYYEEKEFSERFTAFEDGKVYDEFNQVYSGEPYMVSEYGGFPWRNNEKNAFGYGNSPQDESAFVKKYVLYSDILHNNPRISGVCYTQLYNVEQEQNGFFFYDRTPKFSKKSLKIMADAMRKKAKYEEE